MASGLLHVRVTAPLLAHQELTRVRAIGQSPKALQFTQSHRSLVE